MSRPAHIFPAGSVGTGRRVPVKSARQRAAAVAETIGDLVLDSDLEAAMEVIRDAMQAQTTIRAPKKIGEDGKPVCKNDYLIVADTMSRLAAVRLLWEFKYVKPATVLELPGGRDHEDEDPPTRDEMIAQLRASKVDLAAVADVWLNAARVVEETGPLPPDISAQAAEMRQTAEKLAVIEV